MPRRLLAALLAGATGLVGAGAGLFWYASSQNLPDTEGAVAVAITAGACEPMELEVPAGLASFHITNRSDRPLEWEILDGVMVVAERENIAPGYSSVLSERLKPGVYQVTCGLLSNPRGKLTVLATAQSEAERAAPPLRAFLGPLSERRVQMMRAASGLTRAAQALEGAIAADDLAAAKAAWQEAALHWVALGPVASRAADLQNRIAPQAAFLAMREADPGFTGLSRIEYGLFAQGSTAGLEGVAQALLADTTEMQARVKALDVGPEAIGADAARFARTLAEGQGAAGLGHYAGDEGAQLAEALATLRRAYALLAPLLGEANPAFVEPVEAGFAQAEAALQTTPPQRAATSQAFGALGEALAGINANLGLER